MERTVLSVRQIENRSTFAEIAKRVPPPRSIELPQPSITLRPHVTITIIIPTITAVATNIIIIISSTRLRRSLTALVRPT